MGLLWMDLLCWLFMDSYCWDWLNWWVENVGTSGKWMKSFLIIQADKERIKRRKWRENKLEGKTKCKTKSEHEIRKRKKRLKYQR